MTAPPIPFPWSTLVVLAGWPVGWAYLGLRRVRSPLVRRLARAALVAGLWLLPLATSGPGPAQLVIGLLAGYLAIRIVALGNRFRSSGPAPSLWRTFRLLAVQDDILQSAPAPSTGAAGALALGLLGCGACIGLLVLGNELRLWRVSRLADDMLVCLEVGVGVAGIHGVIVGTWAAIGRPVEGLQARPILSASFAEFWGERWNRLVASNLERAFFRPLLRRGWRRLAIFATFLGSGLMHVVPVLSYGALGPTARPALLVLAFFLIHAALVAGEQALGLHRAPADPRRLWLARARTASLFIALSPLLLDVYGDLAGVHGRSLDRWFRG